KRKQRVVLADPDVDTGMNHRAALADDDAACGNRLSAIGFDAQALRFGIAAVARAAARFFVCHGVLSPSADDAVDLELGVVLAMALMLLVVLAPPHLENRHLVGATMRDDDGLDRRTGDGRLTQTDAFAFPDHQHL